MTRPYDSWRTLLADERLPAALIDLDAVDSNLDALCAAIRRPGVTLRVASKSVRHPGLMRRLISRDPRVVGLMTFSAFEAQSLFDEGFDDLLMGYPVSRVAEAEALARISMQGARVIALVDDPRHVALLAAAARAFETELALCVDLDMSWRPLSGRIHIGVRRSPLRDRTPVLALAREIARTPGVRLQALLAYEAQVAGLPDRPPGQRLLAPALRLIKKRSRALAAERRAELLDVLTRDGHEVPIVNGGGTGSLRSTSEDPSVTEVTVGSGFLCSHLFDHYDDLALRPAAFFALTIARRSDAGFITCAGGGYIASGPPAPDRAPIIHSPSGLEPLAMEGWGEVQTPLRGPSAPDLALGDPIICRHAKTGELAERFNNYMLFRGEEIVAREPTYRGLGWQFM